MPDPSSNIPGLVEKIATLLGAAGVGAALVAWFNGRAKTQSTSIRKDEAVEVAKIDQSTTLVESLLTRVKDLENRCDEAMESLAEEKARVVEARLDLERAVATLQRVKAQGCSRADCPNRLPV